MQAALAALDRLFRDQVARIPVYDPEWSDLNASDPGVTILELFAFLTENVLYRFNLIPESADTWPWGVLRRRHWKADPP